MTLARDAGLAAFVLVAVVVAGAVTATAVRPLAALAGALGTVVLELLASARAATVQRLWTRRPVQALAVAGGVLAVAVTATFAPAFGLNALGGAILAYLVLVALVAGGVVPPTTAWRPE